MKTLIPLLCALALPVSAELPAEAQKLVEVREREINKINVAYLQRLDALLVDLRAKGDAAAVAAIEKLVAEVEGGKSGDAKKEDVGDAALAEAMKPLVGTWMRDYDGSLFVFKADGTGDWGGGDTPFKVVYDPAKKQFAVRARHWINYVQTTNHRDILVGGYELKGKAVKFKLKRVE